MFTVQACINKAHLHIQATVLGGDAMEQHQSLQRKNVYFHKS